MLTHKRTKRSKNDKRSHRRYNDKSKSSKLNKIQAFQKHAKKVLSQNKEDGLLEWIFDCIGWTNRKGVEICCGDGIQCNLSYFVRDHKLNGLFFDKNEKLIKKGQQYWSSKSNKPKYVQGYVFKKEIGETIKKHNMGGQIDVFSLDMDGVDYWILKDLLKDTKAINPRVIVVEFQDIIGPNKALTVPYQKVFSGWNKWAKGGPNWSGASLLAFSKLLNKYNLVGVENKGFNAFFIRKDVHKKVKKELPTIKPSEYKMLWDNLPEKRRKKLNQRWNLVKNLGWVRV